MKKLSKVDIAKIGIMSVVFGQGLYYSITQPGPMDTFNAAMGALVFVGLFLLKG